MVALGIVAVALFIVGLFTRAKLSSRYPAATVYTVLALGVGAFAAVLAYLVADAPALEALGIGGLWVLVIVAMPLGNLLRDRSGRSLR